MKNNKSIAAIACIASVISIFVAKNASATLPIQHWRQANGAEVFLVESHGIPMLDVQLDFDAGSRRDPAQQAGLAEASANMALQGVLAAGGLPALDENALGEAWADLGASLDASVSRDRLSFSLRSLTEPALLDAAVQLAARQLGEPSFDAEVWARDRARISAALKEAETRPGVRAAQAYAKAVYADHPYGFESTALSLAQIDVGALQDFYRRSIRPCRAKLSLVGAVTRPQAEQLVQRLLERLPQTACSDLPALASVPEVAQLTQASEQRIAFASAQAQVLSGQPAIQRRDPDFFALLVGNHILGGGGFVSRLTHEVREQRGLSYSVGSDFAAGLHAGAFTISLQTRPDQAAQALGVVRQVLADFVANGPTEAELQAAQANLIGGFALRIDSNQKLLGNVANIAWNGLPLDYLDHWTQRIAAVSRADIRAAFQRVLQPQTMATVILGAQP